MYKYIGESRIVILIKRALFLCTTYRHDNMKLTLPHINTFTRTYIYIHPYKYTHIYIYIYIHMCVYITIF